ncbi:MULTISPECIES: NADH oxidoreductase [Dickeya]|uniref:NADH oxidoreductase hcr n=1 Tax=Dickeya aquatica TaxID=1401087 RepID=A0A375AA96_9GAMM|nr:MULTISPECIES: NADH oxidoreductase [Dickeya]SLM62970.1 NADH oxidoreductase hcr [Dickeya aquatica]
MAMPTAQCPHRMQVHSLHQETPDVWTLSLISHDFYPWQPGQYALVSIANSEETLRAYTLSSTPGISRFITLTVRRLENGIGSRWLTEHVKPGTELWLSDAQGEFTCTHLASDRYLMLAAGCGVTPIMSMTRWLLANRPEVDIQVIFNVRDPQHVIFADEWRSLCQRHPEQLHLTLMAEQQVEPHHLDAGFLCGRLTEEVLHQRVPDIASRTVMTCGPHPYMQQAETFCLQAGVAREHFFKEQFGAPPSEPTEDGNSLTMRIRHSLQAVSVPVGTSLLAALESHHLPVNAACRAGVCGSCKTQILRGHYTTSSTMTLTQAEIEQGYVLACSCQLHGDVELA